MDGNPAGSFEEQLSQLRSRVALLEATLRSYGIVPEQRGTVPSAQRATVTETQPTPSSIQRTGQPGPAPQTKATPAAPAAGPPPRPSLQRAQEQDHSLESRIGSQWFNRIGIVAVLIGVAWFLKLAIDNHWIEPLGRVLAGLIAGAALVAWSERFRSRGYAAFSYSLKAVGSGILYLSLWAAFSLFHLIPSSAAFAAMIAVTAFNGFMSWIQDAELLAVYAIVGGLSTPLLLSTGENHEITLFSYILLLDLAVLVLAALRPWSRLLFGAFAGTVMFFAGWWFRFYSDAQFSRTAFFLSCFFLLFALAPRLVRPRVGNDKHSAWDGLALVLMPILNAGLGFIAFRAMVDQSGADWTGPWLAVAFAVFYLLLLRLPAWGVLRENTEMVSSLHLAASVVFLTIAIPLKAHGRWLTIGWLVEGAALLWVAVRVKSLLLRVLAVLCLILGLAALVIVNPAASTTPFINERFGSHCAGIAVFAFVAWLAHQTRFEDDPRGELPWAQLSGAAVLVVNALILLAIGWEIHSYWWFLRWTGNWTLMHDYKMYAQFTYSAFFMLFGAVLLGVGFSRHSAFLRWQALALLAVAIGKVFIVDISQLSQGYRIISFLGLGALLLVVSFVYQRDWLNLRGTHAHVGDVQDPDVHDSDGRLP